MTMYSPNAPLFLLHIFSPDTAVARGVWGCLIQDRTCFQIARAALTRSKTWHDIPVCLFTTSVILPQMLSASESSLSEAETNKLIDQNMRLQKVCNNSEREVESLKQQNLELLHQRDFYQDQVSFRSCARKFIWIGLVLNHEKILFGSD